VVLNVVNRHLDQPIEAEVQSQKGEFSGSFEVAEVNGPDIKAENDFSSIRVQTMRKSITARGDRFTYRFPPHSYTMLRGTLK
jgi:alpha-N-arabinofuranosidase